MASYESGKKFSPSKGSHTSLETHLLAFSPLFTLFLLHWTFLFPKQVQVQVHSHFMAFALAEHPLWRLFSQTFLWLAPHHSGPAPIPLLRDTFTDIKKPCHPLILLSGQHLLLCNICFYVDPHPLICKLWETKDFTGFLSIFILFVCLLVLGI